MIVRAVSLSVSVMYGCSSGGIVVARTQPSISAVVFSVSSVPHLLGSLVALISRGVDMFGASVLCAWSFPCPCHSLPVRLPSLSVSCWGM